KFYEIARAVQDRMAGGVEVFDRSVRKDNAVFNLEVGFLVFGSLKNTHDALAVLGMKLTKKEFCVGGVIFRPDVVYPINFRRHCNCPGCKLMPPTAGVA